MRDHLYRTGGMICERWMRQMIGPVTSPRRWAKGCLAYKRRENEGLQLSIRKKGKYTFRSGAGAGPGHALFLRQRRPPGSRIYKALINQCRKPRSKRQWPCESMSLWIAFFYAEKDPCMPSQREVPSERELFCSQTAWITDQEVRSLRFK